MYHICFTNPEAWLISCQNGVYGNVISTKEIQRFWGLLRDLLAVKDGDKIFFYVKESKYLVGLFQVVNEPYFCEDTLFNNPKETYPFRFNFKEVKHYDNPLPISELALLIEHGKLYSISTFEKDANAPFRGIRQISIEEGNIIGKKLIKYNAKANLKNIKIVNHPIISLREEAVDIVEKVFNGTNFIQPTKVTFTRIPVKQATRTRTVAAYEYAIHGYLYYCLRRNLNNVIADLDLNNITQCLLEVPMLRAQQFRSDILCLYHEGNTSPHFYSFIEIKRDQLISVNNLSQLIGYMKTYAYAKSINFNSLEGVYISNRFDDDAIKYLLHRKNVEKENPIRLIKYSITSTGSISFIPIQF